MDQETKDLICARLAEGKSLKSICRSDEMPASSTVLAWVEKDKDFADQYTRARSLGYQLLADEIIEISDNQVGDVSRDRLSVDSRKWMLSKMLPKLYGDKIETVHSGEVGIKRIERVITRAPE